ncbi:hypothetical protein ACF0H5_002912 [Mactra antiquata]
MCDRHSGKVLDHYCLEHNKIICSKCASEEHAQTPCESIPLNKASKHIVVKLEHETAELRKLKSTSQSILDGKRHDDIMRTAREVEEIIDNYALELKRKLKATTASVRPFSELSQEERWKLKSVVASKIPNGPTFKETLDNDDTRDMATRLQEVTQQVKTAKEALHSLPNYVELSINQEFLKSMTFVGNPMMIKRNGGTEVSDDEILQDSNTSLSVYQETVFLIEKSSFQLEHCKDIAVMSEFIIASVGDSVQKRDRKRMAFRQAISIQGASTLGVIGETTEVFVMQKIGRITILETIPSLKILYALMMHQTYIDVSYLESVQGIRGCPEQSPVFVVGHSKREPFKTEFVDLIHPRQTRYPGKPPTFLVKSTNIADSSYGKFRTRFRGITSLSTFQNTHVIVGASKGVTCLSKTGNLIWTLDLQIPITDVICYGTLVFVSVKDESKIITIGKQGHVIEENILPSMDLLPQKMSAFEDTLFVKHWGVSKWAIFRKIYENVNTCT